LPTHLRTDNIWSPSFQIASTSYTSISRFENFLNVSTSVKHISNCFMVSEPDSVPPLTWGLNHRMRKVKSLVP